MTTEFTAEQREFSKKAIEKLAEELGVTAEEVRQGIEQALKGPKSKFQTETVPTAEEFLLWISYLIADKAEEER